VSFLEVINLKTYFFTRRGIVKAVDGVSFSIEQGETFGIVGESGCGKSITCLSIIRLIPEPAGRIVDGVIRLEGENLLMKSQEEMAKIRGSKISMILQDPMTSLNPVFTIGNQLTEAIKIHKGVRGKKLRDWAKDILNRVHIPFPEECLKKWPHQLSGGMRQRVVGAISISCEPKLLIADEPTTSLDATIQLQYLRLLKELQEKTDLTMIFVTHDFGLIAKMCRRAAVMYAGKIVEIGNVKELFDRPSHPYTQALMKSIPKAEEKVERLVSIEGQPPILSQLPPGCAFAPRCSYYNEKVCKSDLYPDMVELKKGHFVSCWRYI
jgi:oligopeptide/dipeptide ABC transporter ATP-binding protein